MSKRSLSPPFWTLIVAAFLMAAPGVAAAKTVVVIGPAAAGRGAKSVARAAHRKLVRTAKRLRLRVRSLRGRKAAKARRCLRRASCARRLARRLRADALLSTSVWRRGRRIRLSLRLVNGRTGRRMSSESLRARSKRSAASRAVGLAVGMLGELRPAKREPRPQPDVAPDPQPTVMASAAPAVQAADEEMPP